jgi:hypothetical protein
VRGYALDSSQPEEIDKAPFWLADSGDPPRARPVRGDTCEALSRASGGTPP